MAQKPGIDAAVVAAATLAQTIARAQTEAGYSAPSKEAVFELFDECLAKVSSANSDTYNLMSAALD